jgi:hypothetical protein
MLRKALSASILIFAFFLLIGSNCNQPAPQPRPGNPFDGSAYWARDIAQPLITNFAAGAQPTHYVKWDGTYIGTSP